MTDPDDAAAPYAPPDVTGTPAEISDRHDEESDAVRAIVDDRQREMAESEHGRRWDAYLEAWHAAADGAF